MNELSIIGGGLAGSEAAWQLATRGVQVTVFERKPGSFSPAHHDENLAELVCSNSFGSELPSTGSGLLQAELEDLNSLILKVARKHRVPAGRALAVDRQSFSESITRELEDHPLVSIKRCEINSLESNHPVIVATGPLTSEALAEELRARVGLDHLYFYDAISPIVLGESIDREVVFSASRYQEGPGDYLNCPLSEEEYRAFVDALLEGDTFQTHNFEDEKLFHGCQPIESMAGRGKDSLAFGPMKPVGLIDPRSGRRPFAVVQLRREDSDGRLWNLVGFQTKLRRGDQSKVFRMIPGLERAEFVRWGSIHRNTFINAPAVMDEHLRLRKSPQIWLGGQLCGVEGYLESTMCGLMAGLFLYGATTGLEIALPPNESMTGGLLRYLREAGESNFQPMNANFGLLPPLETRVPKKQRREKMVGRARARFKAWLLDLFAIGIVREGRAE